MKRYKVKEIADLLDITPQTLRRYDKLGIVAPSRDEENDYRTYLTLDFMQLLRLKGLRNYDLSLKNCRKIFDSDIKGASKVFLNHADALAAEIERLKELEHQSRLQYARLKDCEELSHLPYKMELRPAYKFFSFMDVHDLTNYSQAKEELGQFTMIMPPMRSCIVYPRESLPGPQYIYGLCAPDNELTGVDEALLNKCVSYPPCYCLTTVEQNTGVSTAVSTENSTKTSGQMRVENMLKLVEDNGYEVSGDIIGEILHMWKKPKKPNIPEQYQFHHYIKMWIPIKPLSEK